MLNQVMLIGRLGKRPEMKDIRSGQVCKFSVATDFKYKNKDGEKIEKVTWHNCVAYGKLGEVAAEHLRKGSKVFIQGRIDNTTSEVEGVKRYYSSIVVESFKFLDSKADADRLRENDDSPNPDKRGNADDFDADDMPF